MSNVKIGFRDWTSEVTWSGGSWETDYPVSNVGDIEQARVARSTDATEASTQLIGTLSSERPMQLFGIVLPNASINAQFRIKRRDNTGTEISDSGWINIYPEAYSMGELLWEDDNFWLQTYASDQIAGQSFTRPYDTGDFSKTKEFDILISDTGNSDGYLDIAYVSASEAWQSSLNIAYGAQHSFQQRSKVVQSRGGTKTFDRLPKPRRVSATIDILPHDEAMGQQYELQRQLDITEAFLWHPYPDQPKHWLRTTFIARQRELTPIERAVFERDAISFEFEEVL